MVGTDLKAETMKLMEKRTAIEAEMNVIIERLTRPGGPGLSGNLVDSEGFPRTDIDIPVVRAERRRLSELRNDHKEITDKLDENIQVLHSARLAPRSAPAKGSGGAVGLDLTNTSHVDAAASESSHNIAQRDTPTDMDVVILSRPFAVVDEITDGSPAAEDGLQLGDQIVKFGNVESGDNLLQRLSSEAQANQGHALTLVAMRQGEPINLTVTPRAWQGRGLLGCHFRIL
ncbi:26S proteasome non-ATPase regulatory subunit 9 isoform X2 [Rhodamnia argentea]|uniref:26S proteasome non-ATPase regulatory subunit 9 isoform X2 n=1 Tax=Rhodamnia argentea TaxID=178133 RepID=A0A8B8NM30_9MYRT|nr:26S proteasome non-ATPase regulatory subunit 9 isoform X2 [Rhodamnia argentea]